MHGDISSYLIEIMLTNLFVCSGIHLRVLQNILKYPQNLKHIKILKENVSILSMDITYTVLVILMFSCKVSMLYIHRCIYLCIHKVTFYGEEVNVV